MAEKCSDKRLSWWLMMICWTELILNVDLCKFKYTNKSVVKLNCNTLKYLKKLEHLVVCKLLIVHPSCKYTVLRKKFPKTVNNLQPNLQESLVETCLLLLERKKRFCTYLVPWRISTLSGLSSRWQPDSEAAEDCRLSWAAAGTQF